MFIHKLIIHQFLGIPKKIPYYCLRVFHRKPIFHYFYKYKCVGANFKTQGATNTQSPSELRLSIIKYFMRSKYLGAAFTTPLPERACELD